MEVKVLSGEVKASSGICLQGATAASKNPITAFLVFWFLQLAVTPDCTQTLTPVKTLQTHSLLPGSVTLTQTNQPTNLLFAWDSVRLLDLRRDLFQVFGTLLVFFALGVLPQTRISQFWNTLVINLIK